jgi:predicted dehydrogenase
MADNDTREKRKVRLGMVGGGPGSNIGETHRYAARIDNRYELLTGVFATDSARSQAFAAQLGIAPDRRIRVVGSTASIEWVQENANELRLQPANGPHQILTRGSAYLSPAAQRASRLWPGHPEGFLEAFANIYNDVADAILAHAAGVAPDPLSMWYPNVFDGVMGVRFIDAAVASHAAGGQWVKV